MTKKIFKIILLGLVIGGIIFLAILKVKQKKQQLANMKTIQVAPLPVEVAKIKRGYLPITEHFLGDIKPVLSFKLSSKISGYLIKMDKYEGDVVKKGEVVAKIDPRQIQEKIASLEADIEGAKSDVITKRHIFERNTLLYKNQAISTQEYEISKTAYDISLSRLKKLKSELSSTKVDLSYAIIKSPVSGIVLHRFKEPGDIIMPGTPIIEIESPDKGYRIIVKIPQELVCKIKPGDIAYLTQDGKKIKERIYKIHPSVEIGSLGAVEIRTKNRPFGLPTYGKVGVDLVLSQKRGLIVPIRAVLENVKNSYIFITHPYNHKTAKVHIVKVSILGRNRDRLVVQTKESISDNTMVIVGDESTLLSLQEGQEVSLGVIK